MQDMRALFASALMLGPAMPVVAQAVPQTANCDSLQGAERSACRAEQKAAKTRAAASGVSAKDAKLVNGANIASEAKATAGDLAGAAAIYQAAIDGAASPVRHHLYLGLATMQRRQGIAAYNAGPKPEYPPEFSDNAAIRAANAKNAALQAQKIAAAVPLIRTALATAAQAATLADAAQDRTADPAIGIELREDAGLLYRLDRAAVFATPRASAAVEATWLQRWLTAANPPPADQAARYGVPVAAALTAGDTAAGLALADAVQASSAGDIDGALGYAEIVVAAKTPAGDPHRAKAQAGLAAVEGSADSRQRAELTRLKVALATASL